MLIEVQLAKHMKSLISSDIGKGTYVNFYNENTVSNKLINFYFGMKYIAKV